MNNQLVIVKLDKIKDLIENGQWDESIIKFKKLNCSAAQYTEYLNTINEIQDIDIIRDFALLGFYAKETIFEKDSL